MSLQRPLQDLHARADAITRLRLLGDNADELTKWQADVELREAKNERERARKEREARAQQASNDWTNWYARIDERIAEHFKLNFPGTAG